MFKFVQVNTSKGRYESSKARGASNSRAKAVAVREGRKQQLQRRQHQQERDDRVQAPGWLGRKNPASLSTDVPGNSRALVPRDKSAAMQSSKLSGVAITQKTLYRMNLGASFAEGYLPDGVLTGAEFGAMLSIYMNPPSKAMETANTAITLLHLGSNKNDERLVFEARRQHLYTVQLMQRELEKPEPDFDGLLGASQNLLTCELYKSTSAGLEAWQMHVRGMAALVSAKSLESWASSPLRAFLFLQFRHVSIIYALTSRNRMNLLEEQWLLNPDPPAPGRIEALIRLALRVPAFLELADLQDQSAAKSPKAYSDVANLEYALTQWYEDYQLVRAPLLDDTAVFTSFLDAVRHAYYWTVLMLIREAMLDLGSHSSPERAVLIGSIDKCAGDLLDAIPYLYMNAGGLTCRAITVRGPLYFASRWYRRTDQTQKLQDCLDTEDGLRKEHSYLEWGAVMPFSYHSILWADGGAEQGTGPQTLTAVIEEIETDQ